TRCASVSRTSRRSGSPAPTWGRFPTRRRRCGGVTPSRGRWRRSPTRSGSCRRSWGFRRRSCGSASRAGPMTSLTAGVRRPSVVTRWGTWRRCWSGRRHRTRRRLPVASPDVAAELTRTYQAGQRRISRGLLAELLRLWRAVVDPSDMASFVRFAELAAGLVGQRRAESAQDAARFYELFRASQVVPAQASALLGAGAGAAPGLAVAEA